MKHKQATRMETLRTAAAVAPLVRDAWTSSRATAKRIRTLDSSGRVVRVVSAVEIVEKQLLREGIEIGAPPGQRPKALRCDCGMPYLVPKKGKIAVRCARCEADRWRCSGALENGERCTNRVSNGAWRPCVIAQRRGAPPMCHRCGTRRTSTPEQRSERTRKAHAAMTPEQRSERSRKANAAMTPEQRSERSRNMHAATTPEQRMERARKMHAAVAALTHEQRSEIARKRSAAMTPEQRSERSRKAMARLTPEQRSENGRKAAAAHTPEQRSEISRKMHAARTQEQRSEAIRKGNATRRKNRDAKQGRPTP